LTGKIDIGSLKRSVMG